MTRACFRVDSVPKKIVAPNTRSKAATRPVFLTSAVHDKALKHFSGSAEANRLNLMLDRESCQENGHESILSKGNTKLGMTGDLKNEAAIAAFIQQAVVR